MKCALSTIHQFEQERHHLNATLQWLFRCYRHLGVVALPVVRCLHWSASLDRCVSCAHEIGIEWHRRDGTLIEWERIVQLHFLLCGISEHFDHGELVRRGNRGRHFIIHVINRQLEFEFVVQSHDIAFQIAEEDKKSIESGYHWYADGFHRSTVVGGGIVNDHCGE